MLPGPSTFDFDFKHHPQQDADQNDQQQHRRTGKRLLYRNRPNDIPGDQELETEQDGAREILTKVMIRLQRATL
jgi:hypothetical protein